MSPEPCTYCDFIGPFVAVEQPVRDAHRAWHDFTRTWVQAFGPLMEAFRSMAAAGDSARRAADTLTGLDLEPARRAASSAQARKMRELGYGCVYAAHEDPRILPAQTTETRES